MSESLHASEIKSEQVLEEEHLSGVSNGAAVPNGNNTQSSPARAAEPVNAVPSASQQTNNSYPSNVRRPAARKETFFGIPQPSAAPLNMKPNFDDDNYETRFPPDALYEEASPNARVYRVYIEESAKYDAYMTDEAREGLDVLLVFAGLFSAVLTTFVAQTSQSLQPDRATETTLLLREVTALQRAQISGASIDSIPSTPANFVPSSLDVWVNGLWFTSLTLSLICALLAVLMKQWIRHYMSFVSGTAEERCLIRQYRFMGLQQWHVPTLIGILPVLLHFSLAIFLVGLTLFLVPLRLSIAGIVGSFSALIFVAYVTTAVWPLFRVQCPYRTPLSTIIHDITFPLREYVLGNHWAYYVSLKEQERINATFSDVAHAFEWLLTISSNPSVHRVVAQSIGGLLRRSSSTKKLAENMLLEHALLGMIDQAFGQSPDGRCILPEQVDLLDRLFRTELHKDSSSFFWTMKPDIRRAIQVYPAPTLQWESVAIAFMWHSYHRDDLAERACAAVNRLMSEPPDSDKTRLPVIVWEDLLAAASSPPHDPLFCLSDPADLKLNKTITEELAMRVCSGWKGPSALMYNDISPISFDDAIRAIEGYVWFLLSPFDKHKGEGDALDSKKVQRLLSLLNAIVLRGLLGVEHDMFFGTCKELIWEMQVGFVTLEDEEAICEAADALLQAKPALQHDFGPNGVLISSLLVLQSMTPRAPSHWQNKSNNILVDLIELDLFQVIHDHETIGLQFWSNNCDANPQVASLIASLIRTSFELRPDTGDQLPGDSRWLEYLCLPANSAAIVFLFACQGTAQTLAIASAARVRSDILLFFSRRPLDSTTLRECKTFLSNNSYRLSTYWPNCDMFNTNIKVAHTVIDELISTSMNIASSNSEPQSSSSTAPPSRGRGREKVNIQHAFYLEPKLHTRLQIPEPGNRFIRHFRRSRRSADPEAEALELGQLGGNNA